MQSLISRSCTIPVLATFIIKHQFCSKYYYNAILSSFYTHFFIVKFDHNFAQMLCPFYFWGIYSKRKRNLKVYHVHVLPETYGVLVSSAAVAFNPGYTLEHVETFKCTVPGSILPSMSLGFWRSPGMPVARVIAELLWGLQTIVSSGSQTSCKSVTLHTADLLGDFQSMQSSEE